MLWGVDLKGVRVGVYLCVFASTHGHTVVTLMSSQDSGVTQG